MYAEIMQQQGVEQKKDKNDDITCISKSIDRPQPFSNQQQTKYIHEDVHEPFQFFGGEVHFAITSDLSNFR
jgi:hypothetical protein